MAQIAIIGADIHDGVQLHHGMALVATDDAPVQIVTSNDVPRGHKPVHVAGGTLLPGFVDLQVNGGGGIMFNDAPSVDALRTISKAHARTGTLALLPTIITDTPSVTRVGLDAVVDAMAADVPGIVGLHLEGPHLATSRKGAHDPSLIRKMKDEDLRLLIDAAQTLPNVMVTVAPESVEPDQITALTQAGVIVSLGHSDAEFATCKEAIAAGACCVTHLFNAMSQLSNREPGLVGAALEDAGTAAGLIADGIHVHPATIRAALRAKQGPSDIFLVTDAMATVGSDITEFELNGRKILRANGKLTLANGTLAGADLDMPGALRIMTGPVGENLETAIARATSGPAAVLRNRSNLGSLSGNPLSQVIHLSDDLETVSLATALGA